MPFRTKLDYSNNRQIKQHPETLTHLSGGTSFGVPFSALTNGVDYSTTGITETYNSVASTFSGNSATTIYNWYDSRMSLGESGLSALTPTTSAITQSTIVFTAITSTIIDGNTVILSYSGVSFSIFPIDFDDLGGGNYSGTVTTSSFNILSATSLDFTGRTIWVDVSGITRTDKLIISNNPIIGYVFTCSNSEGMGEWQPSSGGTSGDTSYWSASTGTNAIVVKNSNSLASGTLALAEGNQSTASGNYSRASGLLTIASGDTSYAEGVTTTASGLVSHAEGALSKASGDYSHAEGYNTTASNFQAHAEGLATLASGSRSHAEGSNTTASGDYSHSEGFNTTASGNYSHAGGGSSIASGNTSFVHGSGSTAGGTGTVVLGNGITGSSANTVYVGNLNIGIVGAGPGITDLGIDANGNVVDQASDISLKENIKTISNALNIVLGLRGVEYNWKDREKGGDDIKIGFIAQEVNQIIPELTYYNRANNYMGVHYKDFPALLVEAIKELATGNTRNNTYLETQTILAEDNDIQLNFNGDSQTAIGGGVRILHARGENKSAELIIDNDGNWITNNDIKSKSLTIPYYTPSSSNDNNGSEGNITRDNNYLYLKTNNGWKRTSLESF